MENLSSRYYTVAVDLRGHGRSEKPDFGYTLAYLAKDIHDTIEELNLDDLFMIGWSMGGSIVFEYMREYGDEHLKGICIVDIGPYSWKTDDYPIGCMDYGKRLELVRKYTMSFQESENEGEAFVEKMFRQKADPSLLDQLKVDYEKVPAYVRSLLVLDLLCGDYRSLLLKIDIPTLIVRGAWYNLGQNDPTGEYMHKRIKGSTFTSFQLSGRCPFLEEPEKFNQVLSEFIESYR